MGALFYNNNCFNTRFLNYDRDNNVATKFFFLTFMKNSGCSTVFGPSIVFIYVNDRNKFTERTGVLWLVMNKKMY